MATRLDLADAQLLGFSYGKWNNTDIVGLIESMNLTKKEWIKLKTNYPTLTNVDEEDVKSIDVHLGIN